MGIFWRAARIGERLSPYVSLCCVAMAVSIVLWIHESFIVDVCRSPFLLVNKYWAFEHGVGGVLLTSDFDIPG